MVVTKPLYVDLPAPPAISYPIWIGKNLLYSPQVWLPKTSNIVVITDDMVRKFYASHLMQVLTEAGHRVLLYSFPAGETSKNRKTKRDIETQMLYAGCDRETLILGLGGGVVGDIAGFVAATYMRGIAYINLPTTLLAMVDSAIGGKTSINTAEGKNLIGSFWQPKAVIADITCLSSLPNEQFINGHIEALKMFLTSDAEGWYYLNHHREQLLYQDETCLTHLINRAVRIKASVVCKDEKENHQRAILNFGHTIGHALEHLTNYQILHGYAVGLGILIEAKIAQLMGLLPERHYDAIAAYLALLNIHAEALRKFNIKEVLQSTKLDKKQRAGTVRYVLLKEIGKVYEEDDQFTHPVTETLVETAFLSVIKETEYGWK